MNSESTGLNDFLEETVLLDESQYKEGYKDGYNDGLISGKEEGREVGLKTGFQVGEELGFYQGCIDVWNSVIQIDPEAFTPRVRKNIAQLEKLLDSFPLMEPENENAQEILENIRLKFRVACANLRVRLEYEGQPTSLVKDSEEM
jgi:flagellar biosynthesis/type III secretory pathway protein FliH